MILSQRLIHSLQWLASHRRRVILTIAAALYIVSILYAPWVAKGGPVYVLNRLADDGIFMRYGTIFSPPYCALQCHYELDVSLLFVEWVFIAIMTAIAWLWNKN